MKITGNEPAYPIGEAEKDRLDQYPNISYPGLSIRQQFAMAAMQGLVSNPDWAKTMRTPDDWDAYIERVSIGSVELADALIAELNRTEADNV